MCHIVARIRLSVSLSSCVHEKRLHLANDAKNEHEALSSIPFLLTPVVGDTALDMSQGLKRALFA